MNMSNLLGNQRNIKLKEKHYEHRKNEQGTNQKGHL